MTLNAIIVDDEPAARSMLRQLISAHCPMVNLVDEAPDVKSAVNSLDLGKLEGMKNAGVTAAK